MQKCAVIALPGLLLPACSKRGDNVYWIGPDRSNMAIVTMRLGEDVGKRGLWIEDARSGEVFVDGR